MPGTAHLRPSGGRTDSSPPTSYLHLPLDQLTPKVVPVTAGLVGLVSASQLGPEGGRLCSLVPVGKWGAIARTHFLPREKLSGDVLSTISNIFIFAYLQSDLLFMIFTISPTPVTSHP